jgi:ribosome-associated protein
VSEEWLEVGSVRVPIEEVVIRVRPSGGPGGQHANRSATAVDVSWSVRESTAGGAHWRARVEERTGGVIRASSSRFRSQWQNRRAALAVLEERIREAAREETPRRATRPTRASATRRTDEKRRRAETKVTRRRPLAEE